MEEVGLDETIIAGFSTEFSQLSAERFIREILVDICCVREIHAGVGYRFGYRGEGNLNLMRCFGEKYGFSVHEIPLELEGEEVVSSSAVRNALLNGELRTAIKLLGHGFQLCGTVERGKGLARQLGFATANLRISERCLLPRYGVYRCIAYWRGEGYPAVVNIGMRPSTGGGAPSVEAHLLDFNQELYGEDICISLIGFLRPERYFENLDMLRDQVAKDIEMVRNSFSTP
jgi:riboflavin kinase/FMN adenylyltransferase